MKELKRNILGIGEQKEQNSNPRFWFGGSNSQCMQILNGLIIGALRRSYFDFTYGMSQIDREALSPSDPCVMKLSDGFLGILDENDGLEKVMSKQEQHLAGLRKTQLDDPEQQEILRELITQSMNPSTSADIEGKASALIASIGIEKFKKTQAWQRFTEIQAEQDCRSFYRPVPYIGYFVSGLLTDPAARGPRAVAGAVEMMSETEYWQTRNISGMWKDMEERFRSEGYEEGLPDDNEFRRRLSGVVRKYLDRTYMQIAATGELKETVRGRLRRGRTEKGEFIYVRSGSDHDEEIERIREFLRKRTDPKEKWKPADSDASQKKRQSGRFASWGNYNPGPTRVSECMVKRALLNRLFTEQEFKETPLTLRQPTSRSGRRGIIGPRHQLEDFLHVLFRLAEGTMYMRGIIEAILRKLPELDAPSVVGTESRTGKAGNATLEGIDYEQ